MTLPLPQHTSTPVPPRWRWRWLLLLVMLAGIGALGWHIYTGQRAVRQLREAGFEVDSSSLEARVRAVARGDWRLVFDSRIWKSEPWRLGIRDREFRNLDAIAPALRRVNPEEIFFTQCTALENVDGLKGLTHLQRLDVSSCHALQNVDGLKGLTGLQILTLSDCPALQNVDGLKALTGLQKLYFDISIISPSALRELRTALPQTDIRFPPQG